MQRRSLLFLTVAVAVGALGAVWQDRFANVQIKTTPVAGNIYMLEGAGGNIGVSVGDDGLLLVDSQFAPLSEKIKAALKKLGRGKLRFLLNTHHHGDHVGGNPNFGGEAAIIAHDNVLKRLSSTDGRDQTMSREGLPVVTFDESLSVHFNGEEIRVVHFPSGHTDGDSVIFFTKSKVVHLGDHFFSGRFPYIDLGGGGDVEGFMKNIDRLVGMLDDDVKIIPGHGPLSTLKDLKSFQGMLRETVGLIREKAAAGTSLEKMQTEGLPAKWDSWGEHFINTDRWIQIIHSSLQK